MQIYITSFEKMWLILGRGDTPQKPYSALKATQNRINDICFYGALVASYSIDWLWFRFCCRSVSSSFSFFGETQSIWIRQMKISRHCFVFSFYLFSIHHYTMRRIAVKSDKKNKDKLGQISRHRLSCFSFLLLFLLGVTGYFG